MSGPSVRAGFHRGAADRAGEQPRSASRSTRPHAAISPRTSAQEPWGAAL